MTNIIQMTKTILLLLVSILFFGCNANRSTLVENVASPKADNHQHLFSKEMADFQKIQPVHASDVIGFLDDAGINKAVVLSTAYSYGRPEREPANEYEMVKAENDFVAEQASQFPGRLKAFCSFNPLKDYAIDELERCANRPDSWAGIKMHFGNSDVQLENPEHVEKLKKVFSAANKNKMPIVIHMRASISKNRPYGSEQARIFLEQLLPIAQDIPIQIAHLAASGPGYVDTASYQVIDTFIEALKNNPKATKQLWFDIATVGVRQNDEATSLLLADKIRKIGVDRILYGSDASVGQNPNLLPKESWEAFCKTGLTRNELNIIANNVAPYLR